MNVKLTPEVATSNDIFYLVKINGEEGYFVDNEKEAILTVDSVANFEMKRNKLPGYRVFREDLNDGRRVKVFLQSIGTIYNGSPYKIVDIDITPVSQGFLLKNRKE